MVVASGIGADVQLIGLHIGGILLDMLLMLVMPLRIFAAVGMQELLQIVKLYAVRAVTMVVPVYHLEDAHVVLDGLALTVEQISMNAVQIHMVVVKYVLMIWEHITVNVLMDIKS